MIGLLGIGLGVEAAGGVLDEAQAGAAEVDAVGVVAAAGAGVAVVLPTAENPPLRLMLPPRAMVDRT